jgi:hypothetical protein
MASERARAGRSRWRRAGVAGLALVASWGAAYEVRAQLAASLEDVALGLEGVAVRPARGPLTVRPNSARFRVAVEESAESVAAVAARAAADCTARSIDGVWAAIGPDPVLRREDAGSAVVGCLVPDTPWRGPAELLQAVLRFGATLDLSEVGRAELVIVRRSEQRTVALRLIADSALRLPVMFPARGDAPGGDLAGVPRPPRARRVLVAEALDAEPAVVGYRSEETPGVIVAGYRQLLEGEGWQVSGPTAAEGAEGLLAHRADRQVLVAVSPDAGGCTVGLVRLR